MHKNYITKEETVEKDKPDVIKVLSLLGRSGRSGYLISDDGTIKVKVNDGQEFTLEVTERWELEREDNLAVDKVVITTESTTPLGYRFFMT